MEFQINATSQGARACTIKTAHSTILTPVFMPVGTQGTVKALDANDMLEMGAKIILGNTYHLYLQPGADIVANHGGFAKMMHWESEIKTKQIKKSRCLNSAGFF